MLETVSVPPDHAAEMVAYDTLVGEFRVHYAGFFDPGFGHESGHGRGARAVLEVRSREVPFVLEHGQTIGRLVFEVSEHTLLRVNGAARQAIDALHACGARVAVEDFRTGQCDGLIATAFRTRQFNPVAGSIDTLGATTIVKDGKIDIARIRPLARLGSLDYTSVEAFFTMMPKGVDAEASMRGRAGQT